MYKGDLILYKFVSGVGQKRQAFSGCPPLGLGHLCPAATLPASLHDSRLVASLEAIGAGIAHKPTREVEFILWTDPLASLMLSIRISVSTVHH